MEWILFTAIVLIPAFALVLLLRYFRIQRDADDARYKDLSRANKELMEEFDGMTKKIVDGNKKKSPRDVQGL